MEKNKRGWIRIIEACIAVLLVIGVVLIITNRNQINLGGDNSYKIYETENFILREIELNDSLRSDILNAENLPVSWENLTAGVKEKIIARTPANLECKGMICFVGPVCSLETDAQKEVYAQSVLIAANTEKYSPRELKLFCWGK